MRRRVVVCCDLELTVHRLALEVVVAAAGRDPELEVLVRVVDLLDVIRLVDEIALKVSGWAELDEENMKTERMAYPISLRSVGKWGSFGRVCSSRRNMAATLFTDSRSFYRSCEVGYELVNTCLQASCTFEYHGCL